jgi:hypothetical protein
MATVNEKYLKNDNYIKLPRGIIYEKVFRNPYTFKVFMYFLLKASVSISGYYGLINLCDKLHIPGRIIIRSITKLVNQEYISVSSPIFGYIEVRIERLDPIENYNAMERYMDKDYYKHNYIKLPRNIIADRVFSNSVIFMVFMYCLLTSKLSEPCFCDKDDLSDDLNLVTDDVDKALKELAAWGYIRLFDPTPHALVAITVKDLSTWGGMN